MTSNFDKYGSSRPRKATSKSSHGQSASASALDNLKRDRFELLSAYIDGEVTASERLQVKQWLKTDHNMRCLHSRLLKLRQGLQTMEVPTSERSVEQTLNSVYRKADRRPKLVVAGIGAALALLAVPMFSNDLQLRFANLFQKNTETLVEPIKPEADGAETDTEINLDLNNPIVGPAAAGLSASEQLDEHISEISKDDVMIELDKSIIPIPEVDEPSKAKVDTGS